MKKCGCCNRNFETSIKIGDKRRNLSNRKFCLTCSPFGTKDCRHPKDRIKDKDGCRTCSCCKLRKPLNKENFPKSQEEKSGFKWLCKKCSSLKTIARQKVQKQKCLDYKGNKCQICGYSRCKRALHFHHKNPQEKDFMIAKYRCRAWEIVTQELDKCMLVCSNCHAEIHDGLH